MWFVQNKPANIFSTFLIFPILVSGGNFDLNIEFSDSKMNVFVTITEIELEKSEKAEVCILI